MLVIATPCVTTLTVLITVLANQDLLETVKTAVMVRK